MVVGLISAHIAGGLADDHGQLALVMHERHVGRAEGAGAVADKGVGGLQEAQRFGGGLEGQFLGVVGVVDGQGEGGARLDGRQPLDLVFGQDAAVRQAHQAGAGFGGGVDDSVQDDAGVFHGGVR